MEKTVIKVNGMSCDHCAKTVTEALSNHPGVSAVKVDLRGGIATVQHEASVDRQMLANVIAEAGYEAA